MFHGKNTLSSSKVKPQNLSTIRLSFLSHHVHSTIRDCAK